MREYGRVSPRFWTGKTGKSFRGNVEAQLLALYLMTSPHSNMIGVFHCPVMYMAHETGLTIEGASKALKSLIQAEFCTFDGDEEVVWVHEMAAHQIGESLSANDKQVIGIRKQYDQIHSIQIRSGFAERYATAFHLEIDKPHPSPSEAPPKPGTGTGTGEGIGEGKKTAARKQAATPIQFSTWVEQCKAAGETAISGYKPVFDYAEKIGLPTEYLELCWLKFKERFGKGGTDETQRQSDWRRKFRKAVEGNWFKLWWINPATNAYELTTAGQMARRSTDDREAA